MTKSLTLLLGASILLPIGCSSGGPSARSAADGATDAPIVDASLHEHEAGRDAPGDGTHARDARDAASDTVDAPGDAPIPTTALVRLANWSPDAPGLDFCVAPHGTGLWTGPLLASNVGHAVIGRLILTDAGLPVDASHASHDATASTDARDLVDSGGPDAGAHDGASTSDSGAHDARLADANDASTPTGVIFPRVSPYVALSPGQVDVRVVAGGSPDCAAAVLPEIDDLPALRAGDVDTFAAVGDTIAQGTDPGVTLALLPDDTRVAASSVGLRFVNAVPSVIEVTLASGTIAKGTSMAYLSGAQFGAAGVDTDAAPLDPNAYLMTAPIHDQIWSLINANGGIATLVAVEGVNVPAGSLATVVGIGGESGPGESAIGILLCIDTPPIVAGEAAACDLFEEASQPVFCAGCP